MFRKYSICTSVRKNEHLITGCILHRRYFLNIFLSSYTMFIVKCHFIYVHRLRRVRSSEIGFRGGEGNMYVNGKSHESRLS